MEDKISHSIKLDFGILFERLPGLMLVLSPEFVILAANDSYLKAIHKTREELVDKKLFDAFPPSKNNSGQDGDSLQLSLKHVLEHKTPHTVPLTHYDIKSFSNKENRYWNLVNTPVLNTEGELLYIIHEVRNITNQVEEEEQVRTSHNSLRLMAKIVGGAVWEYDILNKKFTWSESYKTLFGYSDEDLQVEPDDWSFRVHPEDIAKTRKAIDKVIKKQSKSWTGEYRYQRADGSYADVLDHGYILYDVAGNPVRMLGSMIDLSKQKEYERELQESNERFELVARATNDVIWDWNLVDNSIWWNEGFEKTFGHEKDDFFYSIESWIKHIHHVDLEQTEKSIQKAINSDKKSWQAMYRFMCKDGSYKFIQDKGYIVRDEDGQAIRMIGAMLDITEKHAIEQKLQESNNRTKQILESLPLMTWTAETNGSVNYYSQSWYEYTGYTFEELRDWGWKDVVHPDDIETTVIEWIKAIETGHNFEYASRWKSRNGSYRWFLARAVPIRDTFGSITSWVGSHTDIEEQKQLLLSVQDSNRRIQFLAEFIPQILWTAEPDGSIDYFNNRWYEYTQMTRTESLNLGWEPSVHPDDLQYAKNGWVHSINTGEKYEIELRMRSIYSNNYRWFLSRALPMRNETGKIVKWFGTATDIEDHKRAEEELVEKNLELERINQDLDSFVYTASHDLKLPIVNMAGIFDELIRTADFRDPEAPAMIQMFHKSLRQLHETIHDLSEVVKVQRQNDRELEELDLHELVEDIKISIQDSLKETGARIQIDFADAPSIPFTRSSLKSILYNLINNAIKYRDPNRIPEIWITSSQKDNFIELKIQDNGIGIDMTKHQNKLFQMFKRFHNHVAGSGLGLYIVNRLISNHGGYIHLESSLNEGTTFYLYFKDITGR